MGRSNNLIDIIFFYNVHHTFFGKNSFRDMTWEIWFYLMILSIDDSTNRWSMERKAMEPFAVYLYLCKMIRVMLGTNAPVFCTLSLPLTLIASWNKHRGEPEFSVQHQINRVLENSNNNESESYTAFWVVKTLQFQYNLRLKHS